MQYILKANEKFAKRQWNLRNALVQGFSAPDIIIIIQQQSLPNVQLNQFDVMVENEKKIKRDTKIMATKCAKQYVYLNRPELIKFEKKKKKMKNSNIDTQILTIKKWRGKKLIRRAIAVSYENAARNMYDLQCLPTIIAFNTIIVSGIANIRTKLKNKRKKINKFRFHLKWLEAYKWANNTNHQSNTFDSNGLMGRVGYINQPYGSLYWGSTELRAHVRVYYSITINSNNNNNTARQ